MLVLLTHEPVMVNEMGWSNLWGCNHAGQLCYMYSLHCRAQIQRLIPLIVKMGLIKYPGPQTPEGKLVEKLGLASQN